jgi:hypothetical protein
VLLFPALSSSIVSFDRVDAGSISGLVLEVMYVAYHVTCR